MNQPSYPQDNQQQVMYQQGNINQPSYLQDNPQQPIYQQGTMNQSSYQQQAIHQQGNMNHPSFPQDNQQQIIYQQGNMYHPSYLQGNPYQSIYQQGYMPQPSHLQNNFEGTIKSKIAKIKRLNKETVDQMNTMRASSFRVHENMSHRVGISGFPRQGNTQQAIYQQGNMRQPSHMQGHPSSSRQSHQQNLLKTTSDPFYTNPALPMRALEDINTPLFCDKNDRGFGSSSPCKINKDCQNLLSQIGTDISPVDMQFQPSSSNQQKYLLENIPDQEDK